MAVWGTFCNCIEQLAEERLAERSKARVCKILLNSNMLRLTYPVEHAFETAWPLKKYLKPV